MSKQLSFLEKAWDEYLYWQVQDKKALKRVNQLLRDIQRDPFDGVGKPEPHRGNKAGCWSRRIDDANRIVYRADNETIIIIQCRGHYND